MRRVLVCSTIIAAALLLPATALAFTGPLHGRPAAQTAAPAYKAPALSAPQRAPLNAPYRRVLSGNATVTANIYTFAGLPEVANVAGFVWGEGEFVAVTGATDAAGVATLTGLPAADSNNGQILVYPTSGTTTYDLRGLSWPADGTIMGLQPGKVPMLIYRSDDPYYNDWTSAWVELTAVETNGTHYAGTDIAQSGAATHGDAATITLGTETLDWGAIYYWSNEGAELSVSGIQVSPGVGGDPMYPLMTDERNAHGVWINGWASGKPGTTTWLGFERYPGGWINKVHGQASWPGSATTRSFGSVTMTGAKVPQVKKVTIPSTVKPGYAYNFTVAHTDGPLELNTWFQTCSLAPSKTTISRGGAVRLSGVIPTQGHFGSTPGKAKSVVIYKRTTSAGQPRSWDATRSGWTKAGVAKADRYGKYRSALLHPSRSTWYVVRYPGDDQYWGAFTSVRKVTVR